MRSMMAFLDVWEVTVGVTYMQHIFIYLVDVSNVLVICNSATNCLVYLKGKQWLENTIIARKQKNELQQSRLNASEQTNLLTKSWQRTLIVTKHEFGVRLFNDMLSKNKSLYDAFHRQTDIDNDNESEQCLSVDRLLAGQTAQQIGDRIAGFIGELLQDMSKDMTNAQLQAKIQRVGAWHQERRLVLTSHMWREFKRSTLSMVGLATFSSETERQETVAAWNTFLSTIIREMKMGAYLSDEQETGRLTVNDGRNSHSSKVSIQRSKSSISGITSEDCALSRNSIVQ